jgi:hypothetical protein
MTIAISALAALAAVVSAAFAWGLTRQSRRANELPAIIDLFAEYRSPEMVRARRLVHAELGGGVDPVALHELPDSLAEAATRVGHFLDHLGVLVSLGLLRADVVSSFIGRASSRCGKTWSAISRWNGRTGSTASIKITSSIWWVRSTHRSRKYPGVTYAGCGVAPELEPAP